MERVLRQVVYCKCFSLLLACCILVDGGCEGTRGAAFEQNHHTKPISKTGVKISAQLARFSVLKIYLADLFCAVAWREKCKVVVFAGVTSDVGDATQSLFRVCLSVLQVACSRPCAGNPPNRSRKHCVRNEISLG